MDQCLLCLLVLTILGIVGQQSPGQPYRNAGILRLFYALDDVKNVFRMPEHASLPACQTLVEVFEQECCPFEKNYLRNQTGWSAKFPFIVFEGNHRISTSILSKKFARSISAVHYSMSPQCLVPYRKLFTTSDILLRRGFFGLGVYALAYQAIAAIQHRPVVVTSYWNHQTAFALAKLMNESDIPEPGSPLYSLWPEDLLKPDILFYVNFLDDLHNKQATTREPSSWKPRLLTFYRRLQVPLTIEIDTKHGWDHAVKEAQEHLVKHLSFTKQFKFRNITKKINSTTAQTSFSPGFGYIRNNRSNKNRQ